MKIYFAGAIHAGREDKELYVKIIDYLQKYGKILTEQVGDPNLTSTGECNLTDAEIYGRDVSWIQESDVLIAEVSTPSLGVGYEIRKAEEIGKKILCLYRNQEGRRLSAMISGNRNLKVLKYGSIQEAAKQIDAFFKSMAE